MSILDATHSIRRLVDELNAKAGLAAELGLDVSYDLSPVFSHEDNSYQLIEVTITKPL